MLSDRLWSIVGQVSFMCAVGLIMALMSVAALNAASMSVGPMCGPQGCVTLASN